MRKLALYIIMSTLALAACTGGGKSRKADNAIDTIPVMVMQIRKCAKLYTAEYRVRKIVTHDDDVRLKGTMFNRDFDVSMPMSTRKIAIPMEAKLKAYIDFGTFSEKNIIKSGDKVEIVLPDPKVELTSSRIDHNGIKKHVALARPNFTDAEMVSYEQQGRRQIIMLAQMGYREEDITITFRKDFTESDLPAILENSSMEYGKQQKQQ